MSVNPKCLITGCELIDIVEHKVAHGDLHIVGDAFVFDGRTTASREKVTWMHDEKLVGSALKGKAVIIQIGEYFFEAGPVVVLHKKAAGLTEKARAMIMQYYPEILCHE